MRNPVRTEAEAFSFVLVAAVCFLALALAVALGGRWVGLAVALALVLGIAVGVYIRTEPRVREPAVWDRQRPDGTRRILVVADAAADEGVLREEVRRRAAGRSAEVLVVAPGLRRSGTWDPEVEAARSAAASRAEEAARALTAAGVEARGTVGDVDPIRAVREALRGFDADDVVVAVERAPESR